MLNMIDMFVHLKVFVILDLIPGNGNDQNFQGGGYFRKIFDQGGYFTGSFEF